MPPIEDTEYTIRSFMPGEVGAYKAMRLEALELEPGLFGSSHTFELTLNDAQWMHRIINPNSICLGLYHDNELIGITGVIIDNEKPELGHMIQSYIREPYRGKGLSHMLYDARLEWARQHNLKRLQIGHKASNLASKAANQHYGFKYTHSEARTWPDGSTEDILYYELML